MVSELDRYSDEILNLRCWVAETISIHPGEILMTALKARPIAVSYMMRKKHSRAFLKYVETDDGQITASHKRLEKIIHNGKAIPVGNICLLGSRKYTFLLLSRISFPSNIL